MTYHSLHDKHVIFHILRVMKIGIELILIIGGMLIWVTAVRKWKLHLFLTQN